VSVLRNYVGLGCSRDAPAIAIVDSNGELVFAEAAERFMQYKRGFDCPPVADLRGPELVAAYCEPGAELVLATSWSEGYLSRAEAVVLTLESAGMEALAWAIRKQMHMVETAHWAFRKPAEVRRSYDHHLTHAAAACFSSPFREAVCVVLDGYGEGRSHAVFSYADGHLQEIESGPTDYDALGVGPSLGLLYSQLCNWCGFSSIKGEEWKVMGLAPYGSLDQELYALLSEVISVAGLRLTQGPRYRDYLIAGGGIGSALDRFIHAHSTHPREAANLAFTGQRVFEEKATELLRNVRALGLSDNLVFGGGCALNSSYNGKIRQQTGFSRLHVWAAPGDDGTAVGAAWLAFQQDRRKSGWPRRYQTPYLGSAISTAALQRFEELGGVGVTRMPFPELATRTARLLADGKVVGWVQGRAEFGPRALGNRSILADPRRADIKDTLNARVKFREEFRPVAPVILHEAGNEYFDGYVETPYMERTLEFTRAGALRVPGASHVDQTGRLQSVSKHQNEKLFTLLSAFRQLTGCPVLLNTSFNVMGKPIVHSLEDAVAVFYTTGIDVLVVEDCIVEKNARS